MGSTIHPSAFPISLLTTQLRHVWSATRAEQGRSDRCWIIHPCREQSAPSPGKRMHRALQPRERRRRRVASRAGCCPCWPGGGRRICTSCLTRAPPALWHQDSSPGVAAHLRHPLEHPRNAEAGLHSSDHSWPERVCVLEHTRNPGGNHPC